MQLVAADGPDGDGGGELGDEHERAVAGEVQGGLELGADGDELAAQPVDAPGPIGRQVGPVGGKHPQFEDERIGRAQWTQVAAHAGLVGDDRRVAGVGLALAPITGGGPVDRDPGQVDQVLFAVHQQRDQQRGRSVGQVDRPGQFVGGGNDRVDESDQFGFGVDDPARQEPSPVSVEDHDVMMALAGVDPGPGLLDVPHLLPLLLDWWMPVDVLAVHSLRSDRGRRSQSAVETPRDAGRPIKRSHHEAENGEPYPASPVPAPRPVRLRA
jgi:hypothetical protein